jgi:Ca-activated chloride channel family protein
MILSRYELNKEKLSVNKNKFKILFTFKGKNKEIINAKRKKLNISLCIDVSTSMNGMLNSESKDSKLDLAKKSASFAIDNMSDGDYISVVTFGSEISNPVKRVELNKENRSKLKNIIMQLKTNGCTNLHGGWLNSCEDLANSIDKNVLSRVLLISDGQTNEGVINSDEIISNVMKLYTTGISTTCFGIGQYFNESLLEGIASSGGGNFYFIDNSNDFEVMFNDEFNGLSSVSGYNVKFKINLNSDIKVCKNYFSVKEENDSYLMPNIFNNKDALLFLQIEIKNPVFGEKNLGEYSISYENEFGNQEISSQNIIVDFIDHEDYKNLETNNEIKIQNELYKLLVEKEKAAKAFKNGDLDLGRTILSGANSSLRGLGIKDSRLDEESTMLIGTLNDSNSKSNESLSKTLSYQSYQRKQSKF